MLEINLRRQTLRVIRQGAVWRQYLVSTSQHGAGEKNGSLQTPRGRHLIRATIGGGAPIGAVFVGRRQTGEIYSPRLATQHPNRDWILTRILWLSGCEIGKNRLSDVDTMRRYIYIHGAPDEIKMGMPGSIGCIRMANRDVVELFDHAAAGEAVEIAED